MVHKHSENSRNRRDKPGYSWRIKNRIDQALMKHIEKMGCSNKEKYSQGKLKLYSSFKERSGFENYLNESNPKLRQVITKIRINAHKFPTETGRFENKNQTDRICPLCCEGIGNEPITL